LGAELVALLPEPNGAAPLEAPPNPAVPDVPPKAKVEGVVEAVTAVDATVDAVPPKIGAAGFVGAAPKMEPELPNAGAAVVAAEAAKGDGAVEVVEEPKAPLPPNADAAVVGAFVLAEVGVLKMLEEDAVVEALPPKTGVDDFDPAPKENVAFVEDVVDVDVAAVEKENPPADEAMVLAAVVVVDAAEPKENPPAAVDVFKVGVEAAEAVVPPNENPPPAVVVVEPKENPPPEVMVVVAGSVGLPNEKPPLGAILAAEVVAGANKEAEVDGVDEVAPPKAKLAAGFVKGVEEGEPAGVESVFRP